MTSIYGNGGEVVIDDKGYPVSYAPSIEVKTGDHDGYSDIEWFDVDEWKRHYKRDDLPTMIDILDIGFRCRNGYFEPFEPEYRNPDQWGVR